MLLSEYLVLMIEGVLDFLQFKFEKFYISESLGYPIVNGGTHPKHIHLNSILSGVYYARAPKAVVIYFL